jgi:mitogen-activated protein kinase kinase kinase 4
MQREYERDQKLAVANTNIHARVVPQRSSLSIMNNNNIDDSFEILDVAQSEPKCIESLSRFMSVKSRPVGCRISTSTASYITLHFPKISTTTQNAPQTRTEFHETFSNLIKLGSNDKQERSTRSMIISKEEQLWQTEVKDMIWLELQANMADRTLEEQDKFLLAARKNIAELLREIMSYRFNRKYFRTDSGTSSGVSTATASEISRGE